LNEDLPVKPLACWGPVDLKANKLISISAIYKFALGSGQLTLLAQLSKMK
jgi:hypothetical protein